MREQKRTNREYMFHHAYDAPFANAQTLSHAIRNRLEAWDQSEAGRQTARRQGLYHARAAQKRRYGVGGSRAEVMEIMSVLGHKSPKMAMFYCDQARQERMNENAVAKWECGHRKERRQEAQNFARCGVKNRG